MTGTLSWHTIRQSHPDYITLIRQLKQGHKPIDIATDRAKCLMPFVTETMRLGYDEEPNYKLLNHLLLEALLNTGKSPNQEFEWSSKFMMTSYRRKDDGGNDEEENESLDEDFSGQDNIEKYF